MTEKKLPLPAKKKNTGCCAVLIIVLVMFLLDMVSYAIPGRAGNVRNVYGQIAICAAMVICLLSKGYSGCTEIKLLLAYTAWTLISRMPNHDYLLQRDLKFVSNAILAFCAFSAAYHSNEKERRQILKVLSLTTGIFAFVLSAAGIFVVLTKTYIIIPPEETVIALKQYSAGNGSWFSAMHLFGVHRNRTAVWLMIGCIMMLYTLFTCRSKLCRAASGFAAVADFAGVALCHSRTTSVCLALSTGMLVMLIILERNRIKQKKFVVPAACAALAAVMIFTYKAGDVVLQMASRISEVSIPAFAEAYNSSAHKIDPIYFGISGNGYYEYEVEITDLSPYENVGTTGADDISLSEQRDFIEDLSTFTLRTKIWKSVLHGIKDRPVTLLWGSLSGDVRHIIRQYETPTANHAHNCFMQTLLVTGLPGLVLVLAFSIMIVVKAVRMFFNTDSRVPFAAKLLAMPLAAIMLDNMLEIGLYTRTDIITLSFMLAAGVMLGCYDEVFEVRNDNQEAAEIE